MMNVDDELMDQPQESQEPVSAPARASWVWDLALIVILLVGGYFRLKGLNWDDFTHMHPDERFLTMVSSSITSVKDASQYFDTATSTLNPANRGYGFYVYGDLPIILTRYVGEWLSQTGYDQIHLVGRQISAIFDLLALVMVFLIADRLYKRKLLALLAASFYALAVLPIQLSHFFKEDTFMNFFAITAVYFAVRILPNGEKSEEPGSAAGEDDRPWWKSHWRGFIDYAFFGIALGLAVASKINAAPLAILLPGAAFVRWYQLPTERRERMIPVFLRDLALAAILAFLVFRIFQPYAFNGPGFFNLSLNKQWVQNMKDLNSQSSGDVDFPPALQWARRPLWFSGENLVVWGLGVPLGALGFIGFLWMAWRILKGEWARHLLIWGWTGAYFTWQSLLQSRTMRYQLPIYPLLVIMAAWGVFQLWDLGRQKKIRLPWLRIASVVVGVGVLLGTFAWAYAFTRIYTRPFTRAEASRWIYQNVPAPINLRINNGQSEVNQPIAFRYGYILPKDAPAYIQFKPTESGELTGLVIQHVVDRSANPQLASLSVMVADRYPVQTTLVYTLINETFTAEGDPRGKSYPMVFNQPVAVEAGKTYYIGFQDTSQNAQLEIADSTILSIQVGEQIVKQALPEAVNAIQKGMNFSAGFTPVQTGQLSRIYLDHVLDWQAVPDPKTLRLEILDPAELGKPLGTAVVQNAFLPSKDPRGDGYWFQFSQPVSLDSKKNYILQLDFIDGPGTLAVYGSKQAVESTWDDSLPLGLDGYSPYDYYSGVYRSDLDFEMYWDDNADKLDRFETTLDQADYIFISSNRQWGTTVRVPERYPLTTLYYRSLVGCPADKQIIWCYSVAEPGMFSGQLGFDLVKTVESEPSLGGVTINSQFAEEAFTVYDHPKVLIFKKNASYDAQKVRVLLSSVDLSMVVHLTPGQASKYPGNLLLPEESLAVQQAGGTWSVLFNRDALFNQYPGLAVVLWYLTISLMGWMLYPFTRLALRGLPDMGYPLTRLVGMLMLAFLVWLSGSSGIAFSKATITAVAVGLLALGVVLGWVQRKELAEELRTRKKYFLAVEIVALVFFTLFLLVRLGNSDLWHPWKGGEKPMDFSYFNAVLKSTTFPPYDPWFEGGYINYYYWGFVLVGVPTKWLGIIPSIAYNIFLPQLYSMLALGAFSAVWNIVKGVARELRGDEEKNPYLAGVAGAVMLGVLGNLGSLRMIWYGLMKLSAPGGVFDNGNIFNKIGWTVDGLVKFFGGAHFPYAAGDWYWIPSRAIPGEPITEFPAFTFLYADPHAHLIALPITLLCLGWALSILLGKWQWGDENGRLRWLHIGASFLLGGLAIGSLRPTNTWDYPLYLALGIVALLYTALRYGRASWLDLQVPDFIKRLGMAGVSAGLLVGLSLLLFLPFSRWYGQGYNAVDLWSGDHTPFWSYTTHWGLFLFLIISWLVWETREWMATTPVSALKKLKPYRYVIQGSFVVLGLAAIALVIPMKVSIGWFVLPLAAWAGILALRPGMPAGRRAVLFMTGTGLVLTLMVELIVLRGDIGRMNTVFKFYLQAWTLLSLSAAASLAWILPAVDRVWLPGWRNAWSVAAAFLIASAALFPLLGGTDKIQDRMSAYTPHTLDGMTYMAYSTYSESNVDLDLSQDYRAILWMQDNIQGSPVIVEGNVTEYRWGNRYTIYTGLPGVIGWNWHQRQQRSTITPENWVTDRVKAVGEFYSTGDRQITLDFLKKYNVSYIVVGGMEHAIYPADGLAKFTQWNGDLWTAIYTDKDTVIYKVKR